MYQLEALHAVQYYLIEAQTLRFDRTSAIVSPNGAGKSALLDAIQIVLLGADGNAIRLNAQAGGDADGRSIRQYCLGYYNDTEAGHARKHATTYLTLVFRDTDGKQPALSVGVALGATVDDPRHVVHGMYLLPGVALELADHVEETPEGRRPVDWATFKLTGIERCKAAGTKPQFESRSTAFVKALLFALRPESARDVNVDAFRKAFKNALNLTKVPNTDHFIRHLIAEERPINLDRFREQLDSFRELKQKVAEVIARITSAESAEGLYGKAATTRMHRASYAALAAEYRRDAHNDELDAAQAVATRTQAQLASAHRHSEQADRDADTAREGLQDLLDRARSDPDFERDQAADEHLISALVGVKKQLVTPLQRMVDAFDRAARAHPGTAALELVARPWRALLDRVRATAGAEALALDVTEQERKLLETVPMLDAQLQEIEAAHRSAQDLVAQLTQRAKVLEDALRRAQEGKAPLRDAVMQVRRVLEDAGIQATPVCDLVRVTDPSWAPAIEGYLRGNVDALLIEPGREDEAIARYEAIPASYNVFNVKLVRPASTADRATPPDAALAGLIEGTDPNAVAFVRARLGRLRQLERASVTSAEGLTKSGMLVKHGTVERLMLLNPTELKLGQRDARERRDTLAKQRHDIDQQLRDATRHAAKQADLQAAARQFANGRELVGDLVSLLVDHGDVELRRASLARARREGESRDLISLREAITEANARSSLLSDLAKQAHAERGKAETAHTQSLERQGALQALSVKIEQEAMAAFRAPYVDAGWADAKRTELEKSEPELPGRIDWCERRIADAEAALAPQLARAWNELNAYAVRYQIIVPFEPEDIDAALALLSSELRRLRDSELATYQQQAAEAFHTATVTFRSRIAAQLSTQFEDLRSQIRALNKTLQRSPAFTNDERYHFKMMVAPEHKALYDFVTTVAERGESDTMFESPALVPKEFQELLEDSATSQRTLLEDYRLFFTFDVEVQHQGRKISTFGARMRSGSGGEHRAPLFVVAGAALAAAYGKSEGDDSGLSLIVLDELGDKIDDENMRAVFEYLRALGLQPLVAAPGTALGSLSVSLDSYIELYRDEDVLEIQHVGLTPSARSLLCSDLLSQHPEHLAVEVTAVLAERGHPSP